MLPGTTRADIPSRVLVKLPRKAGSGGSGGDGEDGDATDSADSMDPSGAPRVYGYAGVMLSGAITAAATAVAASIST